jgi:hypothetical protein
MLLVLRVLFRKLKHSSQTWLGQETGQSPTRLGQAC